MKATRCLFVPNASWGEEGHVSAGIHIQDEDTGFNAIVCWACGAVEDGCECTIMWEEAEWGADPWHILLGQIQDTSFDIDEKLYALVDEVYNSMCMDVEPVEYWENLNKAPAIVGATQFNFSNIP